MSMTSYFSLQRFAVVSSLVATLFFAGYFSVQAQTWSSPVELEGYAWSSNIGWISMNCSNDGSCGTSNYRAQINNDKTLSGYAWSSNIGWIDFSPSLTGVPDGGGAARVTGDNSSGWEVVGWVRALSYGGGWDGWISMNCTNTGTCGTSSYAVDITYSALQSGFSSNAYAWGSDVIGWINLDLINFSSPCVERASCSAGDSVFTNMWCESDTPVTCSSGYTCPASGSGCVLDAPTGILHIDRTLVRRGEKVTLDWSVASAVSCRVDVDRGPSLGSLHIQTVESSPITLQTTLFTLFCKSIVGGPDIEIDSKEVRLLPNIFES